MKQFNRRLAAISYFPDTLRFESDEEQRAFFEAVGRQVLGFVDRNGKDAFEFVQLIIHSDNQGTAGEVLAVHEPHRELSGDVEMAFSDLVAAQILERPVDQPRPFVVGAVRHEIGDWTYHT